MKRLLLAIARGIGKILLAFLLLFALYMAYSFHAEWAAKRKVAAMCGSIAPGQAAAPLQARALSDGAVGYLTRWHTADGVDTLIITYVGMPPFSGYLCVVKAKGGIVLSASRARLD